MVEMLSASYSAWLQELSEREVNKKKNGGCDQRICRRIVRHVPVEVYFSRITVPICKG
jgi:hypothetical protein